MYEIKARERSKKTFDMLTTAHVISVMRDADAIRKGLGSRYDLPPMSLDEIERCAKICKHPDVAVMVTGIIDALADLYPVDRP